MATWKKVIVSGSNAHLASVTASAGVLVGTNQQITTSPSTTFLSGSFSGSFQGSFTGNIQSATSASYINVVTDGTNATRYLTFVDSDNNPAAYEQLYTDAGIQFNPSTNLLTVGGNLEVNGGDITTTDTTPSLFSSTANATITIGSATSTASFGGTVVIAGGLDVNGTVTTIDTQNLLVADQFILLGSGSVANKDGGIIVQSAAAAGSGFAYFLDDTTNPRWAFSSSVASTATSVTPDEYVVSAKSVGGTWTAASAAPTYGGSTAGYGNMVVDGNQDIWIYV